MQVELFENSNRIGVRYHDRNDKGAELRETRWNRQPTVTKFWNNPGDSQ